MGVFTRFKDIINSNINSILDSAENPEKMIKLMIHEMEDTLVEIKSSCARIIAACKKINRQMEDAFTRENLWEERAALAVSKDRDDLAREALVEKRKFTKILISLQKELIEHEMLVEKYKDDIRQLEDKLRGVREKQSILVQRHIHAKRKMRFQSDIRKMDASDALQKFDEMESRIERMEAEAHLINYSKKKTLEEAFDALLVDEEIEKQLKTLKIKSAEKNEDYE